MERSLNNVSAEQALRQDASIEVFGNGDLFQTICKASSKNQGWMKSTKAMDVGNGCVVQVTTQQRNGDGSYAVAEALTFVPGVAIGKDSEGRPCLAPFPAEVKKKG